jgi:predicted transcriptional regulator of viral defense system
MNRNKTKKPTADRILHLAVRQHLVRPRDVEARGIARESLFRLCRRGLMRRAARGIYTLADAPVTAYHSLAVVAKLVPRGAVCLLSALRFHGLTTQQPHEVWLAIDVKAHRPALLSQALRVVRFSGRALSQGIEKHTVEGVRVQVYSAAKTVADCFKYRHKIGVDVAIEALRDALRTKQASVDEIYRFAKVCRVARVMQPYLESVV